MKTPQIPAMPGMSPLGKFHRDQLAWIESLPVVNDLAIDQKTIAERQWQKPKLAPVPQQACDVGLFGDVANQTDLIDLLRNSTKGE